MCFDADIKITYEGFSQKRKNQSFLIDSYIKSSNSSNRFPNGALREEVEQLLGQKK